MMNWLRKRAVKYAAGQAAAALMEADSPLLNECLDKLDEDTILGMLERIATRTGWKYSNGTVLEHLTSNEVLAMMGGYGEIWKEFLTNLQNRFDVNSELNLPPKIPYDACSPLHNHSNLKEKT